MEELHDKISWALESRCVVWTTYQRETVIDFVLLLQDIQAALFIDHFIRTFCKIRKFQCQFRFLTLRPPPLDLHHRATRLAALGIMTRIWPSGLSFVCTYAITIAQWQVTLIQRFRLQPRPQLLSPAESTWNGRDSDNVIRREMTMHYSPPLRRRVDILNIIFQFEGCLSTRRDRATWSPEFRIVKDVMKTSKKFCLVQSLSVASASIDSSYHISHSETCKSSLSKKLMNGRQTT